MPYRTVIGPAFGSLLAASTMLAACGGAIDNTDLYKKDQGSTTSSSGSTPAPTATATPLPEPGPPIPLPPKPLPKCDVSFQKDVLVVFASTGCSSEACHGGANPRNEPRIALADPPAVIYKTLTNFTMSNGQTYVVPQSTSPKSSGISCNLRGACGVPMPIANKLSSKQLNVIDDWLSCGAPLN